MKGYSTYLKAPGVEPHYQMQFSVMPGTMVKVRSYLTAEVQLAYSTAPTDRAFKNILC